MRAEPSETFRIGDMTVRRLGFGTMQLTGPGVWGPPADRDAAVAVLRRAVDLGVDLIDTADSYGPEVAEDIVREALYPYPAHVHIATKAGMARPGPGQWAPVGRPAYLRQQCEMSLRRLGVERIDLFQLHRVDLQVPPEEQFGLLADLRREGKVAEVGLSDVTVEQVEGARAIVPIVTVQGHFNLATRQNEAVIEHCERQGIGFVPWFPLASGKLARPGGPVERICAELEATAAQVALAWLLRRSPVMLPIPGTASVVHAEENCAAAGVRLSAQQYDHLNGARRQLRRWALAETGAE